MNSIQYRSLSDKELIALFQSGNQFAFEYLIQRYKVVLTSTVSQIVKDSDVAADLMQDGLIKILHLLRSESYNEEGKFGAFAKRILKNLAIDYFRKEKRQCTTRVGEWERYHEAQYHTTDNMEIALCREELRKDIRKYVAQLPENQREIVILRHFNHLSFKEIAEFTDVSINTALGRMRYALVNLRKMMNEERLSA